MFDRFSRARFSVADHCDGPGIIPHYPWLRPEVAAHLDNRFYLNVPSFALRGIIYLIVWFGLGLLTMRALRREGSKATLARIAPAGLILLAITVTFAAIDTTMSLDPQFVSSAYGLVAIAEMGLSALAVSLFTAIAARPIDSKKLRNFGRLLLALLILWAYLDFVQLLIVWQSDLPNEAPWYIARLTGGWGWAAAMVAGGHFILPFFALLSPRVQQSRLGIAAITALLILSGVLRGWWLVVPASGRSLGAVDVMAMLGIIGIAAVVALNAPLAPGMPEVVERHV